MSLSSLTFAQLKSTMAERARAGQGIAASSLPNAFSALKQFMQQLGCTDEHFVGSLLRAGYFRNLREHEQLLRSEGRSAEYRANRKTLLKQWRRLVLDLDKAQAGQSRTESPLQRALRELLQGGVTIEALAKGARVPHGTLKRWLGGSIPQRGKLPYVRQLETHCNLPAGTLTDLLPWKVTAARQPGDNDVVSQDIQHRQRLGVNTKDVYALKNPSDACRQEWAAFVEYKTGLSASGLARQSRGKWATTTRPGVREPRWYEMVQVRVLGQQSQNCPTARIIWTHLAQYLGWLARPKEAGGAGIPPAQAQSLACLLEAEQVEDYLQWRVARSGGILHTGLTVFLNFISSVCHPVTGYLTQTRDRFPWHCDSGSEEKWKQRCQSAFEQARLFARQVKAEGRRSRDSKEPIAYMLSLQNPLAAVTEAIARMDAARPCAGGQAEAIWMRDRVMVKLLASNPLRAKNLKLLTFDSGGSKVHAQLRKVNGVWRIAIDKKDFKNANGAAKDRPYDMPVRPEVWADLEAYIRDYRPLLAGPDNPYLFVSSDNPDEPYFGINRRFQVITREYFPQCPGVGPHAMRHLVATTILKTHPGAWTAAAFALHDREETVRANYAHLSSNDAAIWLDGIMKEAMSGM
ncbi:hypothetical protein ACPWT1_07910 [Ramlibacter sp. MMS24-I3-19]|uniref:hypothetical protein n=1 Tax=Ramlibacter sp. MMS24-I3-19 TaxID=3416606 RepID=UPI003D04AD0B